MSNSGIAITYVVFSVLVFVYAVWESLFASSSAGGWDKVMFAHFWVVYLLWVPFALCFSGLFYFVPTIFRRTILKSEIALGDFFQGAIYFFVTFSIAIVLGFVVAFLAYVVLSDTLLSP